LERIPDEYRDRGVPADLLERIADADDDLATVPAPAQVAAVRARQAAQRRKDERKAAREAEQAAERMREQRERAVAARARAHIPERTADAAVTLHLGPTNSGKTHEAIALLAANAEAGRTGVYAAPLRMLAFEAYERLRTRLGAERVGLRTGEEHLNPDAPVLCCTAEAAPTDGDFLVVDEAHWLADEDRGHAWTRLLLGGAHTDVHVCAAPEAEDLLRKLFAPGTDITVLRHARHGTLSRADEFRAATLPSASAVVAFSRKAVLALHRELLEAGRSATVLYGAMPPAARREQIRRLSEGEVDVIVTTDVIGHGVNLPLCAVAFAETGKYDGRSRRELLVGRPPRSPGGPVGGAMMQGRGSWAPTAAAFPASPSEHGFSTGLSRQPMECGPVACASRRPRYAPPGPISDNRSPERSRRPWPAGLLLPVRPPGSAHGCGRCPWTRSVPSYWRHARP
jgi:ATP-dependent RNA helicase SUPV3L1/SUV3